MSGAAMASELVVRRPSLYRRIEYACAALLLSLIVLLVGLASLTRAMGSPIIWSIEVAQLLFIWLCMLAADLALQERRHFGLSILLDNLPPRGRRVAEIVNTLVLLALLALLLVYAVRNTILMHPRLDGAIQMPSSYIHAAMPVGLVLMLRTLTVQLFEAVTRRDAS